MSRGDRAIEAIDDWRILLPPGWITLPTKPGEAAKAISRLLDSALAGKPRDELVKVRIELDRILREQVQKAARSGAKYVHSLVRPIQGMPVSATLITSHVSTRDPDQIAAALNMMLGEATGVVENGYADLSDRGALRRVRRWNEPLQRGDARSEQMVTSVDYVVPLDDTTVLVMAFSTSTEPVHEELIVLFDAIATTLHRVERSP